MLNMITNQKSINETESKLVNFLNLDIELTEFLKLVLVLYN